jgi:PAS domain S-box-containing protein
MMKPDSTPVGKSVTQWLGKYHLIEKLYEGERTLVYRGALADETQESQPVVLKILRQKYPTFGDLIQFRNQYAIAKNLNIAGIVRPYSLETERNRYFLVMEDCGGISLRDYTKFYHLSSQEILEIACQLAGILHELHHQRVIHKDIKPTNILIHPTTQEIKLIDFSIASLLPKETQELKNPNQLEGTLAYIAPEQTGRMNRGVDYRADFYPLGVTLFELLVGKLPFECKEPLELLHCHLAQEPPKAGDLNPEVPAIVSEIIAKLMAKNAENRYQSALGLKHDLEICLKQLKTTGKIAPFPLAQCDCSDRFIIPEKLYGREREIQTLLATFDRVTKGSTEMMLVAGFSGIGKTAVANEIHKPITHQQGYFIKGKFDQFNRNIPCFAFVQALRDLIKQLLSESDAKLAQWRAKILAALGENARVLIEAIPELERVIGKQPAAPELSGAAAQNRFNLLFQKFISIFTTKEHPLVVFLDDLQWIDSASLKLLKLLMEDKHYLLLLGAYRDNEVSGAHPLMLMVESLQKAEKTIETITLAPLAFPYINQWIADTLLCSTTRSRPLSQLVARTTQGNPFFITQFLKSLHENGQIQFNREQGYWQCDLAQIQALSVTDDVVEFMADRLQKLPQETQKILKLAACIGNQFDLTTLAIVAEQSPTQTATVLWKALQEGFVLPTSQTYKFFQTEDGDEFSLNEDFQPQTVNLTYRFLHDRVQQAAYKLIPEDQKKATHLAIGRLLYTNTPEAELEANIFAIVNHLNTGIGLISEPDQKCELAHLNLIAGRKAKATIAYDAAVSYFTQGIELLPETSWTTDYNFTLALHHERLEVACLCLDLNTLKAWGEEVLQSATSLFDTFKVYETRIAALRSLGRFHEAVETGLHILKLLGVEFPEQPTPADIQAAAEQTRQLWQTRSPRSLLDLPAMDDPAQLAAMQILTKMVPSCYLAVPILLPLLIFKQVEMSIRFGNSPVSIFSYADYGLFLCGIAGDLEAGYEFGQLSLNLLEKLHATESKCRAYCVVNTFIRHWQEPLHHTLPALLEGYQSGLETGDWESVALNLFMYSTHSYWSGCELNDVAEKMEAYGQVISQVKQDPILKNHECYQQAVCNLLGRSAVANELQGEVFDTVQMLPHLQATNDRAGLFYIFLNQIILYYLFGKYEKAAQQAVLAESYQDSAVGLFVVPIYTFYNALLQLARYPELVPEQQPAALGQVKADLAKLQHWAKYAPFNHQHRVYLVEAELNRVLGQKTEAIESYDLAIAAANKNGFLQDQALANERAAQFYLDWGKPKIAAIYLQDAYYTYGRWGAIAKNRDLESRYPQLLAPILQQQQPDLNAIDTFVEKTLAYGSSPISRSSESSLCTALDFASIFKVSQALSSEIELDKLLATLMQVVLETAGAQKAALLTLHDDTLVLDAIAGEGTEVRLPAIACETSDELPLAIINTVKRNATPIVLDDATAQHDFMADVYLNRHQPKSVLCAPILNQGKLIGLLYLENSLTVGVFTEERLEVIQLLCSQAAIALENARLYQASQTYARQLETSLEQLRISETRFQKLADNIPGMIYQIRIRPDGSASMPYASSGCQTLYEVSAEEVKAGKYNLRDFEHPDDRDEIFAAVVESAQNLTPFRHEWRIVTPNGTVKWVKAAAQPERQEDGETVWDGITIDISDRKQAEQELEQAMQELQQAQLQIVQSEKMSALGNLISGVAHEMNNPLGFISVTLGQAKPILVDLSEHLQLYQTALPHPSAEILEHAEEIDLEYSLEDFPKMLDGMVVACDRLKNISTSLRTFSRVDRDYKVPFNIHEGLDSTILILKHRLKANDQHPAIEVVKSYGDLPEILCFPGQLNQVFMNVLANAIDALEMASQGHSYAELEANPSRIAITTTQLDQKRIQIQFEDNGCGMDEETQQRIFEQGFTTKGVGKGTGLGMAIAHQIITQQHSGHITLATAFGRGTTLAIALPIT